MNKNFKLDNSTIKEAVYFFFRNQEKCELKYGKISQWNTTYVTSTKFLFYYTNLDTEIDISNWDMSNVVDMNGMFMKCNINCYIGDISKWDTKKVRNMSQLFCFSNFNQSINDWNTSEVKDMSFMFYKNKEFNQDISDWDVRKVCTMYSMFSHTNFNRDISKWIVSQVIDMSSMFKNSKFNQDISNWDVINVKYTNNMFEDSYFTQDISKWKLNNITNMNYMFKNSSYNINLKKWAYELKLIEPKNILSFLFRSFSNINVIYCSEMFKNTPIEIYYNILEFPQDSNHLFYTEENRDIKTDYNTDECNICYETIGERMKIVCNQCGKTYDFKCIIQWLSKNNTCPTCRSVWKFKKISP